MRAFQRLFIFALATTFLIALPAGAGVVFEIETTDHQQSPPKTQASEGYVEGKNLKMEIAAGRHNDKGDMIYRGDRREMVVVDHSEKSYIVMNEQAVQQMADQVSSAMSQVEEALKNVPADQRAMMEKMLKDRMPPGTTDTPSRPKSELRKTNERAEKNGYPCVKYEVFRESRKLRELWVTDWSNVEGGEEAVDAFEGMAEFFEKLLDSIPDFGQKDGDTFDGGVFEHMRELDGFPVVTREFGEDGSLTDETVLRSATRRALDPDDFEPPAGYKRRSMGI